MAVREWSMARPQSPRDPAAVADFLVRVRGELAGRVPPSVRRRLMEEVRDHLLLATEAEVALGHPVESAARKAVAAFGSPQEVAEEFIASYLVTRERSWVRSLGRDAAVALVCYGLATLFVWLGVYARVFFPSHSVSTLPQDLVWVHSVMPTWAPLPELSASYLGWVAALLLGPVVASLTLRYWVPSRPYRAVGVGLTPCILATVVNAAALAPDLHFVISAAIMVLYWLPCAWLLTWIHLGRRSSR